MTGRRAGLLAAVTAGAIGCSGLSIALASCQAVRAVQPSRADPAASEPHGASDADKAACWRQASMQAEEEYVRDGRDPSAAFGRALPVREDFDKFDAEKRRDSLYQRCLKAMVSGKP